MEVKEFKDLILDHDRQIGTLANHMEVLVDNIGVTNRKLDDVVEVITTQTVLIERFNNLDKDLKESFDRVHTKVEIISDVQHSAEGCTALQVSTQKMKDVQRSVDKNTDNIEAVESTLGTYVSGATMKWALVLILTYAISFGTYVVDNLHTNDTSIKTCKEGKEYVKLRLKALEGKVYGSD